MNIVHVGAHQDDEGRCLGTLLKYKRQGGHNITLICTTNGDKGFSFDEHTPHQVVAATRDREMRAVAEALGAQYICLGAPDEYLYDTPDMRLKLIDALRACQADLIFTDWVDEYNLDHSTTSRLVYQASLLTIIASIKTEHAALKVTPKIFYCPPWGEGYGFEATHFVALDQAIMDEVVRIVSLHESQVAVMRQVGEDMAEAFVQRARQYGARVGVPYAEAFRPCLASRRTPLAAMLP